jgi:hypothetical protein
MSTPDDPADQREVLSSLPRSRRQRPSARREAARAGRATKAKPAAIKTAARPKAKAKPRAAAKPRATAAARPSPRTSTPRRKAGPPIPPAGYATPTEHKGSADPGAALAGLVRGVLSRLPF